MWLPEDDLVNFIMDVVRGLDLSSIYQQYDGTRGGQPPCTDIKIYKKSAGSLVAGYDKPFCKKS